MSSYCSNCRKLTKDKGIPEFVKKIKNYRRLSKCALCYGDKNVPTKPPDVIELQELFKPTRRKFETRKFIQYGIDDTWQADLYMFYRAKGTEKDHDYNFRKPSKTTTEDNIYKRITRLNSGYRYILNVIDTFSKFVWSLPLKNKSGKEVCEAFSKIFSLGRKPKKLQVDKGKEFYNKDMKQLLDEKDIEMYSTFTDKKASIIERFNRTLGDKLKPIIYQNIPWVERLPEIIQTYNNTYHRTIKMKPSEVNKKNENTLLNTVYCHAFTDKEPRFEVGDRVRLSTSLFTFKNKFHTNWSKEIFTIRSVQRDNVFFYKVNTINAIIYESQLLPTML